MSQFRDALLCCAAITLVGCAGSTTVEDTGAWTMRDAPTTPESYDGPQPGFASLRSPLRARVVDRRFRTAQAMYLANEAEIAGDPFLAEMFRLKFPIAEDRDLQYITAIEAYWYSRYNMSALFTESRLGVHLVHGPYVSEKALEESIAADNRDRGERIVSNRTELIQRIIPNYLALTGFPRRFEDASPCMLQFASGDPHLPRPIDKGTDFESVENKRRTRELRGLYGPDLDAPPTGMGQRGNHMWNYRVNYRENFETLRWDHDRMEHEVDMGAEGQTLLKLVLWSQYFFRGHHHQGEYLGNNPEEGYRGAMLNLASVSKMLILKAALLTDGKTLGGVNPQEYDPHDGLRYFPHRVGVRMRYVGDLAPRPEEFKIVDPSSQLFDQASLLWGLSEFYYFADPTVEDSWDRVFGSHPPYDGTLMERKYALLAQGLANLVLLNMEHQHRADGAWVSSWTPKDGPGSTLTTMDLGLSMIALANFHRRITVNEELHERSGRLLRELADFAVNDLLDADGHMPDGFDRTTGSPIQAGTPTLLAQSFAVRGLIESHRALDDQRYFDAARRIYAYMNEHLWHDQAGLYCSSEGRELSEYTPLNLGATIGAMREMILQTGDMQEVQRFKRFWVQAVDASGIQQAEYEETGERDLDRVDGDGDGIQRMEFAGGRHGIAPVFASKVEIQTPQSAVQAGVTARCPHRAANCATIDPASSPVDRAIHPTPAHHPRFRHPRPPPEH